MDCVTFVALTAKLICVFLFALYGNIPMQYTYISHDCKNDKFQLKCFYYFQILKAPISLGCDEFAMGFAWYRKVLACIANSSRTGRQSVKHVILFLCDKNYRKTVAKSSHMSRTRRQPFADVLKHIARKFPRSAQCDKYAT